MVIDWRTEARRYALPVVLLLVATLGALAVRSAVADEGPPGASPKEPPRAQQRVQVKRAAAKLHIVSSGDTLGGIAERYDTTVERLQAWNPRVDPQALRVGQELRVPTVGG
jgi:N-acetylmuramoyl-L-alanine amidase